jgi:hypothetical protein|tara:strand:+ start:250 stop:738 length:489 start_codon:yes stop_codon:yes gene_type:complete
MERKRAILILIVFTLGWIINDVFAAFEGFDLEKPFSLRAKEQPSPGDWIKESQIHVYNDKVIIDIKNAEWASFWNTNSMDPLLDETSNGIEIKPKSENDIQVGDVISYVSEEDFSTIIHRVVDIGYDEEGRYFTMRGDNNSAEDPERVRFYQVQRVLVAVIY